MSQRGLSGVHFTNDLQPRPARCPAAVQMTTKSLWGSEPGNHLQAPSRAWRGFCLQERPGSDPRVKCPPQCSAASFLLRSKSLLPPAERPGRAEPRPSSDSRLSLSAIGFQSARTWPTWLCVATRRDPGHDMALRGAAASACSPVAAQWRRTTPTQSARGAAAQRAQHGGWLAVREIASSPQTGRGGVTAGQIAAR